MMISEERREYIINKAYAQKEFSTLEDGFYYYQGVNSEELRLIADELDRRNELIQKKLGKDLEICNMSLQLKPGLALQLYKILLKESADETEELFDCVKTYVKEYGRKIAAVIKNEVI